MARHLTDQQEIFAQELFKGATQIDAYKTAYPKSKKWNISAAYAEASTLAKHPKVIERLSTLRLPVERKLQYGVIEAMEEALQAFQLAADTQQPGAMVAAATLRSKLQGLLVERKEVKITSFDNFEPQDKMQMVEAAMAELARRKAQALGNDVTDVEPK